MRKRPVEVFYQQERDGSGAVGVGDWFYVGTFKSYPLPDMTPEEFDQADEQVCVCISSNCVRGAARAHGWSLPDSC